MSTSIREVTGDELLESYYWLPNYSFHPSPPLPDKEEFQERLRQRVGVTSLALFEDGQAVALAASTPLRQQVRGDLVSIGGVFNVATHPSSRRKGYARQLMHVLFERMRQQGKPLTCLYPFRESFYERLGYVTFPQYRILRLKPEVLAPVLRMNLRADFSLLPIGDGYEQYRQFLFKYQSGTHGMALFEFDQKPSATRNPSWVLQAQVGGETVALMLYSLQGEMVTQFKLRATRFYYLTSLGRYLLLDWLARHIDQANQLELWLPPYERPETWLSDLQVSFESPLLTPMGRILDVAGLAGIPAGSGRFSFRLHDPSCPWNQGCWQFEGSGQRLQVTRVASADCNLTVQGLSALLYGTHPPADFPLRGWGDPDPVLQGTMLSLFPLLQPYLHEFF